MLSMSTADIAEKNRLTSTGAFLLFCKIDFEGSSEAIRIVDAGENVTWAGYTWVALHFFVGDIGEPQAGEEPAVKLSVSNVSRQIEAYLHTYSGLKSGEFTLYLVNTKNIASATPAMSIYLQSTGVETDAKWAVFSLGMGRSGKKRCPAQNFSTRYCRYPVFKGDRCGYTGPETTCDRTYQTCYVKRVDNGDGVMINRWGGFVGLPGGSYYVD